MFSMYLEIMCIGSLFSIKILLQLNSQAGSEVAYYLLLYINIQLPKTLLFSKKNETKTI